MDREKAENDKKIFPVMTTLVESSLQSVPIPREKQIIPTGAAH